MKTYIISIAISIILTAVKVDGKDSKIVGGSPATIYEYPYQLFANMTKTFCGASIISAQWALTAAHCLVDVSSPSDITLRAGSTNRISGGTLHQAAQFVIHPQFKYTTRPVGDNDFGLIKKASFFTRYLARFKPYSLSDFVFIVNLSKELVLIYKNGKKVITPFPIGTPGVDAVKLTSLEPKPETIVTATGWGITTTPLIAILFGSGQPQNLLAANLTVRSRNFCNFYFFIQGYSDSKICASSSSSNTCKGDSGGPIVDKKTGEQVGVSSLSSMLFPCYPGMPSVFSNVANQRNWIKQVTGV